MANAILPHFKSVIKLDHYKKFNSFSYHIDQKKESVEPESAADLVWYCIRSGVKAVEISRALSVNPSSISRLQSGRLKRLRPSLHAKLEEFKCSLKALT